MHSKRAALLTFYAISGLRRFQLTNALWILYLLHVGWSLWQVGLAEAGFHVVSLLSDLPTGAFADRYGRKLSMAVGLGIGAITTVSTFSLAPVSVWAGGASVALGALGWTFVGGADIALLNGILVSAEPGEAPAFSRAYSRFLQIGFISTGAASAVGGLMVSHYSWQWPFVGTALSLLGALLLLPSLPPERPTGRSLTMPQMATMAMVLRHTAVTVKGQRFLGRLIVFGAVLATLVTINNLYAQSTLAAKAIPLPWITALVALANLLSALGAAVGGRVAGPVTGDTRTRWLAGGTTLLGLSVGLFGTLSGAWAVPAYMGSAGIDGFLDPLYQTALNQAAPEAIRATILSAPGTGFSLGMIVLFPLAGWVMTQHGIKAAYAALALILLLLSWAAWLHMQKQGRPSGASLS